MSRAAAANTTTPQSTTPFQGRRVAKGQVDPAHLECDCPQEEAVILFYRYFAAEPVLHAPSVWRKNSRVPDLATGVLSAEEDMAQFQQDLCKELKLNGKIRVGKEGFNISLVGTQTALASYMDACRQHWSFQGLALKSPGQRKAFFKPTPACLCAFPSLSVKSVDEIVPLHEAAWEPPSHPSSSSALSPALQYLRPDEFHQLLTHLPESAVVLDVRNQYESRIGSFTSAIQPPTRRFSEFQPWLVAAADHGQVRAASQVVTFCTGGIRCEKAGRFISAQTGNLVYTLKGGIEAYLAWLQEEVASGRMMQADSLFKGRNFVFDARGSTGLADHELSEAPLCSGCECDTRTWRLGHCAGLGCNIILSVCAECDKTPPHPSGRATDRSAWCCSDCRNVSQAAVERGGKRKGTCLCEKDRQEALLKGGVIPSQPPA